MIAFDLYMRVGEQLGGSNEAMKQSISRPYNDLSRRGSFTHTDIGRGEHAVQVVRSMEPHNISLPGGRAFCWVRANKKPTG